MQSISGLTEVVALFDPAIDIDSSDIGEYASKRDASKLVFKSGSKPEIYLVRPVTNDVGAWIDSAPNENEKYMRAFYACVVRVKNLVDKAGRRFDEWQPDRTRIAGSAIDNIPDLFTKAEKEQFQRATLYEIGAVAWALSFFPKSIEPTFPVLPTSLQILTAVERAYRSTVAQAENMAATGPSESQPQVDSQPTTPTVESAA